MKYRPDLGDLLYMEGQEFLIVCAYCSTFPIILLEKGMGGTQAVIFVKLPFQ